MGQIPTLIIPLIENMDYIESIYVKFLDIKTELSKS